MTAIPQTPQTGHTTRGHVEIRLGRKLVVCKGCKLKRPKGGWSHACPADARAFMGGAP